MDKARYGLRSAGKNTLFVFCKHSTLPPHSSVNVVRSDLSRSDLLLLSSLPTYSMLHNSYAGEAARPFTAAAPIHPLVAARAAAAIGRRACNLRDSTDLNPSNRNRGKVS